MIIKILLTTSSVVIVIIHVLVGELAFLVLLNVSMEGGLGVEAVPVLAADVVGGQDRLWFPACAIQIGVVLRVSTVFVFPLVGQGFTLSVHWVLHFARVLVGLPGGGLPLFLS